MWSGSVEYLRIVGLAAAARTSLARSTGLDTLLLDSPVGSTNRADVMPSDLALSFMACTQAGMPPGLSSSNVSSPVDLAKLVRAAAANPTIRKYSTDPDHTVYVKGRALEYRSTNSLVEKPDWQVTVQKTGYNADAGRCLVMLAVIDGRDVVIVLLNSWGRLTRIGDANRVRNWMESSDPFRS